MHHHTITLKPSTPYHGLPPHLFAPNPSIVHAVFAPISRAFSIFNFNSAPKQRPNSLSFVSNCLDDGRLKKVVVKDVDVATLGNLCVDIVLNVPKLPPASFEDRKAYMEELSTSRPDKEKLAKVIMLCICLLTTTIVSARSFSCNRNRNYTPNQGFSSKRTTISGRALLKEEQQFKRECLRRR